MFGNIYSGSKALITGHTGFKGSWLVLWLRRLNAEIVGYSLEPPSAPSHYELLKPEIPSVRGCVLDSAKLTKAFHDAAPEIVFHLAAQPLVRTSYQQPQETFAVNVMGTVNVLEACRRTPSVRAVVIVTSDKCYDNREWVWGYRESDAMGGYDPYSASKGCAELAAAAYRNSFFNPAEYGRGHHILCASCRSGNVVGGGDWGRDRLIPDIVKAASDNQAAIIRNPQSVRPWQHVLEPLSGYLRLGQKLLEGETEFSGSWNFGPHDAQLLTVREVVERISAVWPSVRHVAPEQTGQPHEAGLLKLDCSKAAMLLAWHGVWDADTTLARTAEWYRRFYENNEIASDEDIDLYLGDAAGRGIEWSI